MDKPVKDFILSRPALNVAALAKQIDWTRQAMHDWLKSRPGRKIPIDKLKKLVTVLEDYGFE